MLNHGLNEKLNAIERYQNKYGESIFKKAAEKDYAFFKDWLERINLKTAYEKTRDYLKLANIANGINFNGLFIYSIDCNDEYNIYDSNDIFWENEEQKSFLFFGDDSISWYCLKLNDGKYCVLDKPSATIMDSFNSFFDMLNVALENVI